MQPKSNPVARKISSAPQTHRADTLSSISKKTHQATARIEYIRAEGQKMHEMLQHVPDDIGSRLAWLNNQLNQ
jgi:hypothetical protein